MTSSNETTQFRWAINDFPKQWDDFEGINENLVSDSFALSSRPSAGFTLFVDTTFCAWQKDAIGLILTHNDGNKPVEVDVNLWLEDKLGNKFGEFSAQKFVFQNVGDRCTYNGMIGGYETPFYRAVFDNHETLIVCCNLIDVSVRADQTAELKCESSPDFWSIYEQNKHDAIIKVDGRDYKVSKFHFMAHSELFLNMFTSKNKEDQIVLIELHDIDEDRMKSLIKWLYTAQIDDDASIERLFVIADRYEIKLLKKFCAYRMLLNLNKTNAFLRLMIAVLYADDKLKQATLEQIENVSKQDFSNFFMSREWLELNSKHLEVSKEVGRLVFEKMSKKTQVL